MGFWGHSLYENDCTCDIRDDYHRLLLETGDNETAYKMLAEEYGQVIDSEDAPLYWLALADTQWKLGRLTEDVKQRALYWLNHPIMIEFFEEDHAKKKWRKTLDNLRLRLRSEQPPEKKLRKPRIPSNPWNAGDIYACQFQSEPAQASGLYGKYFILQKIGDCKPKHGATNSVVQIFDRIFDEIPDKTVLETLHPLPLDTPGRFCYQGRSSEKCPKLNFCWVLQMMYPKDYPKDQLTFLCNVPVENYDEKQIGDWVFWCSLDPMFAVNYQKWQNYTYKQFDHYSLVMKK